MPDAKKLLITMGIVVITMKIVFASQTLSAFVFEQPPTA